MAGYSQRHKPAPEPPVSRRPHPSPLFWNIVPVLHDPLKVRGSIQLLYDLVPAVGPLLLPGPYGLGLVPEFQLPPGADPAVRRHEQASALPTGGVQEKPLNPLYVFSGSRNQPPPTVRHHQERPVDPPSQAAPRPRRSCSYPSRSEQPLQVKAMAGFDGERHLSRWLDRRRGPAAREPNDRRPFEFSIPTWTAPRPWCGGSLPIRLTAAGGSGDPRVRGSSTPGSACTSVREARRARGSCSTFPLARSWFRCRPGAP
jgi:hypothetical protein